MNQTVDEVINLLVANECHRFDQQFIAEAIRIWDAKQISGVPFALWIQLSVGQQWQEMRQRN